MGTLPGAAVELKQVHFSYPPNGNKVGLPLLRDFSFSVGTGTIVCIMGASGVGKSTIGRLMTGVLKPDRGEVNWSTQFKSSADVIYIDQYPMNSIFPWQSVRRNIEYPLYKLHWGEKEIRERTSSLLDLFRLEHLSQSYPVNLSGGELQRLAVARGLSWRPKLVVLDEAFSALDSRLKEDVLDVTYRLAIKDQSTLVLIIHSLSDVLAIASRCVILGRRPLGIVLDQEISLPYPRVDGTTEYSATQDTLIEVLRHGLI